MVKSVLLTVALIGLSLTAMIGFAFWFGWLGVCVGWVWGVLGVGCGGVFLCVGGWGGWVLWVVGPRWLFSVGLASAPPRARSGVLVGFAARRACTRTVGGGLGLAPCRWRCGSLFPFAVVPRRRAVQAAKRLLQATLLSRIASYRKPSRLMSTSDFSQACAPSILQSEGSQLAEITRLFQSGSKDGGHSSSNNSTGANSIAAMVKPNWGRTQQNIDKHNASTAKTKAMGKTHAR